jgi:hypothetical protein
MWQRTESERVRSVFDEIQDLVEQAERRDMGEQHCGERPDRKSGLVR